MKGWGLTKEGEEEKNKQINKKNKGKRK